MSGGVDSSAAALLEKRSGRACIGVTMRLCDKYQSAASCCTTDDIADARAVAEKLGIPYSVIDFSDSFEKEVIARFVQAYENGRTPNPCVDCNRYLKFGKLFAKAEELGCEKVVTGHYARISFDEKSGRYLLKKASDPNKDQSYVLWGLSQEQLAHAEFPLGEMSKQETRTLAEEAGLDVAKKHDSQDICFVPDGKYAEFLERYTKKTYPAGNFLSTDGQILGKHKGIIRYTVGQRKGLGLSLTEPLYVCAVSPENNTVTLGKEEVLFKKTLIAKRINLISVPEIKGEMPVTAKIRYRQAEAPATVVQTDPDTLVVTFKDVQRAVTKGQSVVLYDGDVVVGGGIIEE